MVKWQKRQGAKMAQGGKIGETGRGARRKGKPGKMAKPGGAIKWLKQW